MQPNPTEIRDVLDRFGLHGDLVRCKLWKGGHINVTLLVDLAAPDGTAKEYVLQRVNSKVFLQPRLVMENAIRVTEHAVAKLRAAPGATPDSIARGSIKFLRASDGNPYVDADGGDIWRIYPCIQNAHAEEVASSEAEAYEAAMAFGRFQRLLADLPGGRLHETIPNFHNTPWRFECLDDAARRDPCGRVASALPELDAFRARTERAGVLQRAFSEGAFPERTVHNDAKFANILLDDATGKAVCVIDLDTVMTGYALHDFGDLVRSMVNPARESERDLSKVSVRTSFFEALANGYFEGAGDVLTPRERELLPEAGWAITIECGSRFLADYIEGDRYFRITDPDENLVRARTQLEFAMRLEAAMPELHDITRRAAASRFR